MGEDGKNRFIADSKSRTPDHIYVSRGSYV